MSLAALDPITLLIVCPLVFLAMLVDAISGGGGLISLTAYLAAGIPAHVALGTNKLSSAIATLVATGRFIANGFVNFKLGILAAISALIGSFIGAKIALSVPDGVIQMIMVFALPVVAFFVLRKKILVDVETEIPFKKQAAIIAFFAFLIGGYDGFYGPGTGTFMLIAFSVAAKIPAKEGSGIVKCANLASNIAALITFALNGMVYWELGLIAAVFGIVGSYVGSGLVLKDGSKVIRPVMLVVLAILFIKVLYDLFL